MSWSPGSYIYTTNKLHLKPDHLTSHPDVPEKLADLKLQKSLVDKEATLQYQATQEAQTQAWTQDR